MTYDTAPTFFRENLIFNTYTLKKCSQGLHLTARIEAVPGGCWVFADWRMTVICFGA